MPLLRQPCYRLLLLLLLGSTASLPARAQVRYAVADREKPVALLTTSKETYLVTAQSVFQLKHKQFVRCYQSAAPIQCAISTDTVIWLGTRQGVLRLNTRHFSARPLALPVPAATITALTQDAAGAIWVGVAGEGAFRYANGALQKALSIPSVNAVLATVDSSVWVGTNIGLNRYQHQQWIRYNEEGVANHEIPDNIVEKLLLDNTGNLWVLMSNGISVFAGEARHSGDAEHLPTVKFIGQPGNEVYSVAYLPGCGHLFATAIGLLLLPPEPTGQLGSFEPATDRVAPKNLLVPLASAFASPDPAGTQPSSLLQIDRQQRVWLASAGEVAVWTVKAFRRFAASPEMAKLSARQ